MTRTARIRGSRAHLLAVGVTLTRLVHDRCTTCIERGWFSPDQARP